MKKETRANLIFLVVFLAISLPGGFILFKKKLNPAAPKMYEPDSRRERLAYVVPADEPDMRRYVPDATGRWVEDVAKEHGYEEVLHEQGLPVLSEDRLVQLIGTRPVGGAMEAALLVWDREAKAGEIQVTGKRGKAGVAVEVGRTETIAMPEAVHSELLYGGYVQPPTQVIWIEVKIPAAATRPSGGAGELALQVQLVKGAPTSIVPVFTE